MNKPRTIAAKFPGVCAQTGKHYPAGTPIYKGAQGGWIAASNTLTGGNITTHDDRHDGRPYHDAPSRRYRSNSFAHLQNCTYCDRPTRGTVCDSCARACGEYD